MTQERETMEKVNFNAISYPPGAPPLPAGEQKQSQGGTHPAPEPETVGYRLLRSGPPLDPREVESDDPMLEVVILWGESSVLHAAHLSPPRAFYLGEERNEKGRQLTDFLLGAETLGTGRLPVVTEAGSGQAVVFPRDSSGEITRDGQSIGLQELLARGELQPCIELEGAWQYPLLPGATARVSYRGFTFLVSAGAAGKRIGIGGRPAIDWKCHGWTLASAALAFLMLLLFHLLPPKGAALNLEALDGQSRWTDFLIAPDRYIEVNVPNPFLEQERGKQGKRHAGEEGAMGDPRAPKTGKRYAVKGPENNPDPHLAREQAKQDARSSGVAGFLASLKGAWNSPTSPWGRDNALGRDPMSAIGNLTGVEYGQSWGIGGLGMRGTGIGGGGTGEGTIGLDRIGTLGTGGYGKNFGPSSSSRMPGRKSRVPRITTSTADVRGSLSKEVIRRTIRRHLNEVRFCYEQELGRRPDTRGRVAVKFMISPTGAVQSAAPAAGSLNNPRLQGCIVKAVRRWLFPAPENGGYVIVTYPFVLEPAGG
jgi:hypothetical protein